MAKVNWKETLGWTSDQMEELRFSGFSFLRQGKYDKAALFFEALVILDPKSAYDAQTLGALYLQTGNGKKALNFINQALEIEPDHAPTLLNKVKALLNLEQKAEALLLAQTLANHENLKIANDASALIHAFS